MPRCSKRKQPLITIYTVVGRNGSVILLPEGGSVAFSGPGILYSDYSFIRRSIGSGGFIRIWYSPQEEIWFTYQTVEWPQGYERPLDRSVFE